MSHEQMNCASQHGRIDTESKRHILSRLARHGAVRLTAKRIPWIRETYRSAAPHVYAALRDTINRSSFGPGAPRFAELLWVDPTEVQLYARKGSSLWQSATIIDQSLISSRHLGIDGDPVLTAAIARWQEGMSWEQTGEIERMMRAITRHGERGGCRTKQDIVRRCARLDKLFETIAREGRLRTQSELSNRRFREIGGIGIDIGPNGTLIRSSNGRHRFAIARILGLKTIPVRIGTVHPSSVGLLPALRRPPLRPTQKVASSA
jgi:hypothetical protein